MSDHVHALFRLSKNLALANIVEEVKTSSSKWVKTQGRGLANFYWQSGYGAFSVSAADVEESRGIHRATRNPSPRGELSRGIPEARCMLTNRLGRAVRVGLIVPPLQGWG